jgi:DNA-binding MarR family transcriptional regulator
VHHRKLDHQQFFLSISEYGHYSCDQNLFLKLFFLICNTHYIYRKKWHLCIFTNEYACRFFDEILHQFKLSRNEITTLMFLYRQTWSRPNLYKSHGISPLNSYAEMANFLHITTDELSHSLRSLENYWFIETVRSGQYFVRKFFTEALDTRFGQDYNEFF